MFAIIKTGGKQYRVAEGETIRVEKLSLDPGATLEFGSIFVGGDDAATGATVAAEVVRHVLGDKIRIGKRRPKSGYRKQTGFRASLSQIEVQSIGGTAKRATAAATRLSAARCAHDDRRGKTGFRRGAGCGSGPPVQGESGISGASQRSL